MLALEDWVNVQMGELVRQKLEQLDKQLATGAPRMEGLPSSVIRLVCSRPKETVKRTDSG
jgi:hypothetical protein